MAGRVRRLISIASLSFLAACAGPSRVVPNLTLGALQNATYQPYDTPGSIKLIDGRYKVDTAEWRFSLALGDVTAFGDVNGGGVADAVVLLDTIIPGSDTLPETVHSELAAVINDRRRPVHVGSAVMGGRVKIEAMTIGSGKAIVSMLTHAQSDPACCPTAKVTKTFNLQGDALVEGHFDPERRGVVRHIVGLDDST